MIIYIVNEIPVRELPGYLLFATVAAANNHQVFILHPNDIWLYCRLNVLPPGVFLVKNLNIPSASAKIYRKFMNQGFDLYCQEQEPPILCDDLNEFLFEMNITKEQVLPFKAVFCYGDKSTLEYKEFFGDREGLFYATGAPRLDIWTSKFKPLHLKDKQKYDQPYILIVSNFVFWMGDEHFSETMRGLQSLELLVDFQHEENQARFLEQDASIFIRMVLAVKFLSSCYPDLQIILRPHPGDSVQYWSNLFEKYSNVGVISNQDSITPWISGAIAVIQNGCTSALEAVIQGVPVISHGPDRVGQLDVPNQLGIRSRTLEELRESLNQIIKNNYISYQKQSENILKPIVKTECKAASEMLSIMEEKSKFSNHVCLTNFDLARLRLLFYSKAGIDRFRYKQLVSKKYSLNAREVQSQLAIMADIMRLPMPRTRMIGDSGLLIEK